MNPNYQSYAARRWYSAVKAKLDLGMPRERAMLAVDREDPKLREQFLAEINSHRTHSRHSHR